MDKKDKFIIVTDVNTAKLLKEQGYSLATTDCCGSGTFLFINNDNLKFSNEIDISKIHYTNRMWI